MYSTIKTLHFSLAFLSLAGFVARGVLHLRHSPWVKRRFARVVPHLVDTGLLLTGLWLAWVWRMHEHLQPWLLAKLVALLLYIALGMLAFRFARSDGTRALAWGAAIGVFLYMLAVAHTKRPLPLPW
ncbi:MAG: SirB2 family protein [Candidatus Competibacteraceae bacterium]